MWDIYIANHEVLRVSRRPIGIDRISLRPTIPVSSRLTPSPGTEYSGKQEQVLCQAWASAWCGSSASLPFNFLIRIQIQSRPFSARQRPSPPSNAPVPLTRQRQGTLQDKTKTTTRPANQRHQADVTLRATRPQRAIQFFLFGSASEHPRPDRHQRYDTKNDGWKTKGALRLGCLVYGQLEDQPGLVLVCFTGFSLVESCKPASQPRKKGTRNQSASSPCPWLHGGTNNRPGVPPSNTTQLYCVRHTKRVHTARTQPGETTHQRGEV